MNIVVDTSMLLILTERGMLDECPWALHTTDMIVYPWKDKLKDKLSIKTFSPVEMNELVAFYWTLRAKTRITLADCSALFLAKAYGCVLLTNDAATHNAALSVGLKVYDLETARERLTTPRLLIVQGVDCDKRTSTSITQASTLHAAKVEANIPPPMIK